MTATIGALVLPIERRAPPAEASGPPIVGAFLTIALLAAGVVSCRGRAPEVGVLPGDTSYVVVVLDACRPDKLGSYGFERETSPSLDAFAADPDSVLFRRHYVQGTWSKPSVASLMTGLYPHQHGVTMQYVPVRKGSGRGEDHFRFRTQVLGDGVQTLAERFHAAGFTTFGVAKNQHILPRYGFAQGFDRFTSPRDTNGGNRLFLDRFLKMVGETSGRFFAYLHLNACHDPFPNSVRDPGYMRRYGFPYDERSRRRAGIDFTTSAIKRRILAGEVELTDGDRRFLSLVYEARLRRADRALVAPLLEGLRRLGRYDDSWIAVTADHGEELGEHDGYGHGHALWEQVVHVPLIVKFPRGRRPAGFERPVERTTRMIDLVPTLLELAGLRPPAALPGRSLFGRDADGALCEQWSTEGEMKGWALVRGDEKLIEIDGRTSLFDLAADPTESRDLSRALPGRVADLGSRGETVLASSELGGGAKTIETDLPPAVVENLRRLGYLEPSDR